nr:photosystem II protein I [Allium anisopodium]
MYFPFQKKSWRLCNAYSQTLCLHSSHIFCFSLHLWILI